VVVSFEVLGWYPKSGLVVEGVEFRPLWCTTTTSSARIVYWWMVSRLGVVQEEFNFGCPNFN
jgi:hypothetical protein